MSAWPLALAGGLTRGWARLYTAGLPAQVAKGRRAEITSDLWEHATAASADGAGAGTTAAQIFGRTVLGMPADVSWHVGEVKGPQMESTGSRTFAVVAAVAVLSIVMGILMLVGLSQGNWAADDAVGAFYVFAMLAGIAGPFVSLAGIYAQRRAEAAGSSSTAGRVLVVSGMAGIALLGGAMYWTIIGPVVALAIVGYWAPKILEWAKERPALP